MTDVERAERLAERIDDTRITYPEIDNGITIEGSPFSIEFDERVDPSEWVREVATPEEPWQLFGVHHEIGEDYYSLAAVLYHVEDGELVDGTKADLEVAPEGVRVYVKGEDADEERVAEFVQTVLDEYGGEVLFTDAE